IRLVQRGEQGGNGVRVGDAAQCRRRRETERGFGVLQCLEQRWNRGWHAPQTELPDGLAYEGDISCGRRENAKAFARRNARLVTTAVAVQCVECPQGMALGEEVR